jgi:hypothetical protein
MFKGGHLHPCFKKLNTREKMSSLKLFNTRVQMSTLQKFKEGK